MLKLIPHLSRLTRGIEHLLGINKNVDVTTSEVSYNFPNDLMLSGKSDVNSAGSFQSVGVEVLIINYGGNGELQGETIIPQFFRLIVSENMDRTI